MASGITVTTNFQNYLNAITDLGKVYIRQEFTGGTDDALDSIDGANLETGVTAFVLKNDICYVYKYIDGATDPENPPSVITPDTNSNGRWFLYSVSDSDKLDGFHASQTPSANTIPVLNSAGQLCLPFKQSPILVNDQDMMSRIFYVDAENGNDNNDGSESAPFKTLKKAIDSIPAGGYGNLFLVDGDYIINNVVFAYNKSVFITCFNVSNLARIKFHTYNSASYERPYCIELRNSQLLIYGYNKCSIETPQLSLGLPAYNEAPFMVRGSGLFGFISCDIAINDFYLVRGYYSAGNVNAISTLFSDNTITKNADKNILVCDKLLFHSSYNDTLQDSSGNPLSWSDVIDGIIRDVNGVPRNIVSNIVL